MAKSETPTTIKKYANRRLYNTGTSTYVTLEDLAAMVKDGEDFLVFDARTGALLGAHIVSRGVKPGDVFANSIVSSRLLASIAAAAGIRHEETLTGFKWISRVEGLRYGYEEALGYCVAPHLVRDKDGVSAALLLAELAATLKAEGRQLTFDIGDELKVGAARGGVEPHQPRQMVDRPLGQGFGARHGLNLVHAGAAPKGFALNSRVRVPIAKGASGAPR